MAPEPLTTLQDSIQHLGKLIRDPSDLDWHELPQLDNLIDDWYDPKVSVSEEDFARRMLGVFQNSTHAEVFTQVLEDFSPERRKAISAFVDGKPAEEVGATLAKSTTPARRTQTDEKPKEEEPRKYIRGQDVDEVFENWGRTVKNIPAVTYYPENVEEVKTIVKQSVKDGRGVRVSGFRHSWSPVFGRDNKPGHKNNGDALISTLTKHNATVLPNFTSLPSSLFQPEPSELNHIKIVDAAYVQGPQLSGGKQYVRVGTSTTNEQFRRWCIEEGKVTLPMNIIEVEITFGGSNATICHGAGIRHPTLSDLVRSIEYVDVHGELQTVDMADADLLKAASGCFGLLGVVTHLTFECDPMTTAVMRPVKLDVVDAVPPPPELKESDIPAPLRKSRTPAQRQAALQEFERRANDDFYAEWFWFPFSSQVWVNTWSTDVSLENVQDYPSVGKVFLQVAGTAIMNMAQIILEKIDALQTLAFAQTAFLSWIAMKNLDEGTEIRTLLPNALHFQRGVQNIRVRDMEVELPLTPKKGTTDVRDYSNVQRGWWDAILACYDNMETCPQRMPLEMRIMGASTVTMAPQRKHLLGTCAIEVLTLRAVADIWQPYAQQVFDKWRSYKDAEGKPLVVKPHWAKEWNYLTVDGRPWRESLKKEVYKDEIAEFMKLMAAIGKKHGWTLAEVKKVYSNDVLDDIFFNDETAEKAAAPQETAKKSEFSLSSWLHKLLESCERFPFPRSQKAKPKSIGS